MLSRANWNFGSAGFSGTPHRCPFRSTVLLQNPDSGTDRLIPMSLWHRIVSPNLRRLPHRHRRLHSLLPSAAAPPPHRAPASRGLHPLTPFPPIPGWIFSGIVPVRSFAAPVQAKPKPKGDESANATRLNEAISAHTVRLVTDEGHSIVSKWAALERAKLLNLDLVEVQRTANPPVCKIMDYHKEKFKQEEKEKELKKSKGALALRQGENKEVRFKAKTELKDLKIKADTIIRLMERGYKVKCTALPRGKGEENLGGLLSQILSLIEDVSVVESGPHIGALQAYVVVRSAKLSKKKTGKKISEVIDAISNGVYSVIPDSEAAPSDEEDVTEHAPDKTGVTVREDTVSFHPGGTTETRPLHKTVVPPAGETNRYSKPNEVNGRPVLNQMKTPQQPPGRGQFDRSGRQPHPGNPSSPPPFVRSGRQPHPGIPSLPPPPPPPRFGNFIAPKPAVNGDQSTERNNTRTDNRATPQQPVRNENDRYGQRDPRQRQVNPGSRVSPLPSFVPVKPGDRSPPQSGTPNSADQKKYGIFTPKPDVSDNQRQNQEIGGQPDQDSPKPSYGIFSSSKIGASK